MVAVPRTRIDEPEPGAPEVDTALTPAAWPCKAWSNEVMRDPLMALSPTVAEAPEISLFFIVP